MTDRRIVSSASAQSVSAAGSGGVLPDVTFSQFGLLTRISVPYLAGPDGLTITGARGFLEFLSPTTNISIDVWTVTESSPGVFLDVPLGLSVSWPIGAPSIVFVAGSFSVPAGTLVYLQPSPAYIYDAYNLRCFVLELQ